MKAATAPRAKAGEERLLVIDPALERYADFRIGDLPKFLRAGDALVVNDAATLPASLRASDELELRLMSRLDDGTWLALALGPGDHRTPTEDRAAPPALPPGTELHFGHGASARVVSVDERSPRLVRILFQQQGGELWQSLYRAGRPIQYAYLSEPLALWSVQTAYAAQPWAFELPSAGKPLDFETLFRLRAQGVTLARVTHAAGLSSTGDPELDARLPIAERYELSEGDAQRLRSIRSQGGRVVAVGTSVTRALEAAGESAVLRAGSRYTALILGPHSRLRVCDGLLTGLHEPRTSHFSLLQAFAPRRVLERAARHAERCGYLQHEFGDSCLVLPHALAASRERAANDTLT
jgi:S-adenosylmethionine:tRNA ribosyltransferase-isomerase